MDGRLLITRFNSAEDLVRIMRHPGVWPWITDDGSPDPDALQIPDGWIERHVYAVCAAGQPVGFALFDPRSAALAEFHGAMLPEWRGPVGLALARMAIARFWQDFGCDKLVAMCPTGNRAAARMNITLGFKREGLLTSAYRRGGRLEDVIVFGMSRGEG